LPPEPPEPGPAVEVCINVEDCGGNIIITTPSAPGMTNPVLMKEIDHIGKTEQPRLSLPRSVENTNDVTGIAENIINPPRFTDALQISIKGLSVYRRSKHA